MKKSFTLGAVSGISALAIGFPIASSYAADQSSVMTERPGLHRQRAPFSQDDIEGMIDRDNDFLLHIDAFVAIQKKAIQNHRIALQVAADITDETERNDAVRAAHLAMRAEIKAAIDADPELKNLRMLPHGHGGRGRNH